MCPQAVFCTASVHNSHNKTANIDLGLVLCCPVIMCFEKASHFPRKGLGGQATNVFKKSTISGKLLKKIKGKGSFSSTHRSG